MFNIIFHPAVLACSYGWSGPQSHCIQQWCTGVWDRTRRRIPFWLASPAAGTLQRQKAVASVLPQSAAHMRLLLHPTENLQICSAHRCTGVSTEPARSHRRHSLQRHLPHTGSVPGSSARWISLEHSPEVFIYSCSLPG